MNTVEYSEKNNKLNLENINKKIKNEICHDTINQLTDENLLDDYKKCDSVKNKISKLTDILKKYVNEKNKKKLFKNIYLN
jgi:hypothetical protein